MATFDFILSGLQGRALNNFTQAVKFLEEGMEAGEIPNIRFTEAKQFVNRGLETAWDKLVMEPYFWGGQFKEMPEEIRTAEMNLGRPAAHLLAGQLKRLQKMIGAMRSDAKSHPATTAMLKIITEAQPLGVMVNELKTKVTKRQPKPVEDRKAKYLAPMASGKAMARVQEILVEITNKSKEELAQNIQAQFNRYIDKYMEAQKEAQEAGKRLDYYDFYRARTSRYMNMEAYEIMNAVAARRVSPRDPVVIRDDAQDVLAARAKVVAEEMCNEFIYKNLAKLDSIIEKKGDFKEAKVLHTYVRYGLEGDLLFKFEDGAQFTVKLQVVIAHSKHGVRFARVPVTFHNVIMSDGSKMKTPNEEKMNTFFVEK